MSVTPARGRQLSLFGVEARPPAPSDLEGLLAGAGEVGRMGGTAKVSIEVEDAWRAEVLRAECEQRGLVVACEPTGVADRWTVRTAYAAALAPLAARWLDGATKVLPADLVLDGRRLRLWVAAAGAWDGQRAYLLRLTSSPIPEIPDMNPEGVPDEHDAEAAPAGSDSQATHRQEVHEPLSDRQHSRATDRQEPHERPHSRLTDPDADEQGSGERHPRATDLEAYEQGSGERHSPATGLAEARASGDGRRLAAVDGSEQVDELDELPRTPGRKVPRQKAAGSKISAFDPGPAEFDDRVDEFFDAAPDDWPDSGVGDLPAVVLDPLHPAPEEIDHADELDAAAEREAEHDRRLTDNWVGVGDALAAVGLIAVFVGPKAGGPGYRIVGLRRITRLAELVGEPPALAPVDSWPR